MQTINTYNHLKLEWFRKLRAWINRHLSGTCAQFFHLSRGVWNFIQEKKKFHTVDAPWQRFAKCNDMVVPWTSKNLKVNNNSNRQLSLNRFPKSFIISMSNMPARSYSSLHQERRKALLRLQCFSSWKN